MSHLSVTPECSMPLDVHFGLPSRITEKVTGSVVLLPSFNATVALNVLYLLPRRYVTRMVLLRGGRVNRPYSAGLPWTVMH